MKNANYLIAIVAAFTFTISFRPRVLAKRARPVFESGRYARLSHWGAKWDIPIWVMVRAPHVTIWLSPYNLNETSDKNDPYV